MHIWIEESDGTHVPLSVSESQRTNFESDALLSFLVPGVISLAQLS